MLAVSALAARVFAGGLGEEVIDHAVQQGGELVAFLRGPVRQGGLHAGGAGLADAALPAG